jgi:hypothetical protein
MYCILHCKSEDIRKKDKPAMNIVGQKDNFTLEPVSLKVRSNINFMYQTRIHTCAVDF